jgi:hypothetical protein
VKEFPEDEDLVIMEDYELEDFIIEVLNPNGDSTLLGIEIKEEDIAYIESRYAPGIQRL